MTLIDSIVVKWQFRIGSRVSKLADSASMTAVTLPMTTDNALYEWNMMDINKIYA